MTIDTSLLPIFINAITDVIKCHEDEVTALDQAIGDGDHVANLQRGLSQLQAHSQELASLDWQQAFQKIGMLIMSSVGGASGSLLGTLFVSISKSLKQQNQDNVSFADALIAGVESVKQRGKSDLGEKTMLDVLIPVSQLLQQSHVNKTNPADVLEQISNTAIEAMESTRDMIATKGRASYLGERSKGHIDAGAKTSQLMICTIADVLSRHSTPPS
ncbi:MAG: dihydroxyacetone kinase subunit L [Gammaproteobacteria bacterium]|nr:dihydroxyacetone kinase subunit L [Gammaproteobacteria bacterium]